LLARALFGSNSNPLFHRYIMRCSVAVLMFMGWSALQSWGQTELIQNGGFESGATSWTMGGGAGVYNTSGLARSGLRFAWLGGITNEVDFCYQQITIPAGATSATLSFYYNIFSAEGTLGAFDTFSATIRNTGNGVLATVLSRSNVNQDPGTGPAFYHQQTFNLLPYAGQTIRVYFSSANDFSLETSFFIDDVSVQVTTMVTPPPNDTCANAIPMTAGTVYTTNTANATSTGDPVLDCQGTAGKGVWYTYTPAVSGTVTISTCGSTFDTVLEVYTGTCGSLTPVICNDDNGPACLGSQASVSFAATGGTTYFVLAAGSGGASGSLSIVATGPLAGLIIIPTWDSTILNDPNSVAIQNTINAAILVYETKFSDPVTVNIKFAEMGSGLGMSSTFFSTISYSTFYNAIVADSKTTNDVLALANIPFNGGIDPVDLTSSNRVTTANQRAIGLSASLPLDGTIYVNMSIINIDRISINLSKFDLMAVVSHEIDEVMGTSSALGSSGIEPNSRPADLFRYNSAGARTYTLSGDDAWFSIDGGTTRLVQFNQDPQGDYGDWKSKPPFPHTPRVQDAFATAGATPNLGVELTFLDVIGWDLVIPAPTPTIQSVTGSGNTINFSWASAVAHGYQVQYKTNLTQVGWLNLNSPIIAIGPVTSSSDTIGPDPRRFYRIALLTSSFAPPAAPLATLAPNGPFTLVTNYFLPEQAAELKGQSFKSLPGFEIEPAKPFKGEVRVQVRGQK
jgi:hypothetical protein